MKNLYIKSLYLIFILSVFILKLNAQGDKSFLSPPQVINNPTSISQYSVNSRKFTGIPSLAVTANGRIWSVWYAGITPDEDFNNYVVVAASDDKGKTWKEVLVIDPDGPGPVRAYDPQVWIDPDGKLWIFWAQVIDEEESKHNNGINAGVWAMATNNADTDNPSWSEPKRLTEGVMMCKPIVLTSGEWVLPASTWRIQNSAKAVVSTDHGQNWQVRGAVNVPETVWNCDEHMIVERKDGTLWMLVRTKYGIGESISNDKGFTWSSLIPSKIQHTVARFFIRRLNSGNLLLVKHGPIEMRIGRTHLMAFISKDDGLSWSNGLLLDERSVVSYPDGQQTQDGTIYITYDYNRTKDKNILITKFTEADILASNDVKLLEVYKNRRIISGSDGK